MCLASTVPASSNAECTTTPGDFLKAMKAEFPLLGGFRPSSREENATIAWAMWLEGYPGEPGKGGSIGPRQATPVDVGRWASAKTMTRVLKYTLMHVEG